MQRRSPQFVCSIGPLNYNWQGSFRDKSKFQKTVKVISKSPKLVFWANLGVISAHVRELLTSHFLYINYKLRFGSSFTETPKIFQKMFKKSKNCLFPRALTCCVRIFGRSCICTGVFLQNLFFRLISKSRSKNLNEFSECYNFQRKNFVHSRLCRGASPNPPCFRLSP